MAEGELEIVISNITDKAGNEGFYYQSNGKKVIKEYKNTLTTNGRKVVYDRTPNFVTKTSLGSSVVEGKTYYVTNGDTIEFSIGFKEELKEDIKVTIGGKEVKVKFDKYIKNDKYYNYKGSLTISEDETELSDGYLEIKISNITDKAGNKGFYYTKLANGVVQEKTFKETTNGRKVFYDTTAPEVTASYNEKTVEEDSVEEFTEFPTFEVKDNSNATVTKELVEGSVDVHKVGTYKLVYKFTDLVGNVTEKTITIKVVDTKAPTISGITNDAYYNTKDTHAIPVANDKNGATLYVKTTILDTEIGTILPKGTELTLVGTYQVYAVDKYGNKSEEITVHIDPYAPKILVLDRFEFVSGAYLPIKPVILEHNLDTITVTLDGNEIDFQEGDQLTEDGEYVMVVTDKAGNKTEVKFTMDSIAPTMTISPLSLGVVTELDLNDIASLNNLTGNIILTEDAEFQLMKASKNVNVLDYNIPIYEYVEMPENGIIDEEGEYILVAYDKAYNVTAAKFVVDKTAPQIKGVENGKHYKEDVTITIIETNRRELLGLDGTVTFKKKNSSGKYITTTFPEDGIISEEGEYSIKAKDLAGNESETITFVVDKTAPSIEVPVKEEVLMGDEKISVVANATDNILSPQKLTPNVTKIVNGVETDLGKQSTIDVSEQGVSYKLEYTITDEAGHTTNKTIITTVVNITYEVRFNEPAYEGTYNGTIHTAPQDAKLYMIKDGVESLVEDAVINYSSETEMKNAGVYTIKAEVNGYYTTTTYTINKAEITVDFSNLPSKAVLNDTLAEYSYLITANHFEGNTEIFDYKMYRTSIGLTSPIPEEAEKVDKVTEGSSWKKVIRTYTIYVSLKEEYEDNYIIKNSINLDLTDYGIDFKVTGVSKTLES